MSANQLEIDENVNSRLWSDDTMNNSTAFIIVLSDLNADRPQYDMIWYLLASRKSSPNKDNLKEDSIRLRDKNEQKCVANICPNEGIKINIMIKWKRLIEKVLKKLPKSSIL